MTHYVLFVAGCVEPQLEGPFEDEFMRDERARELHAEGDDHAVFALDVDDDGKPDVWSYSGAFFESGAEETEEERAGIPHG